MNNQLVLSDAVCQRLDQEGLATANDLVGSKEEELDQAYKNMPTIIPGVPGIPAKVDANGNKLVTSVPIIQPIPQSLSQLGATLGLW